MKKVSIVSGASRGIGREVAYRLAQKGNFVALLARNLEELEELEHDIDTRGGKSKSYALDISDEQQVNEAVAAIARDLGSIEHVVNNAGIGVFKPAQTITATEWEQVMDVNVKGTFLLTKAALPHLLAQKSGHILGIASDVSKRTFPNGSLYCASKYAQDAFFSALRREVRSQGVKVSVIYPGLVDTYFHGLDAGVEKQANYLSARDIADAVEYVLFAPSHVIVDELMLHPMSQEW
jgi:NADP-dependent 3-hydroxy acid dehydrogenase YdfG